MKPDDVVPVDAPDPTSSVGGDAGNVAAGSAGHAEAKPTSGRWFAQVPVALAKKGTPPSAIAVWIVLWSHCSGPNGRTCFPSISTIATATGLTSRAVSNGLAWLREKGWITVTDPGRGRGCRNRYRLHLENPNRQTMKRDSVILETVNGDDGKPERQRQENLNGGSSGSIDRTKERNERRSREEKQDPTQPSRNPLIAAFQVPYKDAYGSLPTLNFGAAGKGLADAAARKGLSAEQLRGVARTYFEDGDSWLKDKAHPVGSFIKNFDRYFEAWRSRHPEFTPRFQGDQPA